MRATERAMRIAELEIRDLKISLPRADGPRPILAGVTLSVAAGEAVGLVGESGSGKSTTARAVMRLSPPKATVSGTVDVAGRSVLALSGQALREFRGREVGMIYQDPRSRINPLRRIGDFITEGMRDQGVPRGDAWQRAISLLESVSVTNGAHRMNQYPGELSGGLLQRVMIASVLATEPGLILADEPTSALDVTTQEEVVAILGDACRERGMSLLFITHDLDLAAAITDRIAVMSAGLVLEVLPSALLHSELRHPYTAALLLSRPSLHARRRIEAIPGAPIAAYESGAGCVFASRCPFALDVCSESRPVLRQIGVSLVACHRAEEMGDLIDYGALA